MTKATVTRKAKAKRPVRKTRRNDVSPQKIHDLLLGARSARMVNLSFKDGRSISGAVIFNEFKGTGRVINIEKEISVDFHIRDLKDVKY